MQLFPLFANVKDKAVLVVGGGDIAERKVRLVMAAGARVTVLAPHCVDTLHTLAQQGKIELVNDHYHARYINDKWLIIAATDKRPVNQVIATDALAQRILVNVVDDPELSSFQVPAIVDRSPLIIAISSSGAAPMIARRVREQLETLFDHSLGKLTQLAERYRQQIRTQQQNMGSRRRFYDWLVDGPVGQSLRQQHPAKAEELLLQALEQPSAPPPTGKVILVGAGPGDPGLLTLHALRALNRADVILYDRLVSQEILTLARRDAIQINVGKELGGPHHATQQSIHELMVEHALAGKTVIRLKGGDGFIFGRGGEELQYLQRHGVDYEVVPGITAALACAAYSGIPLTHRDHAQSVQFVTAHRKEDSSISEWQALCEPSQTLVVYMGLKQLGSLCSQLQQYGRAVDTPCALIENGSRSTQRTLVARLNTIYEYGITHQFNAPSLLIIGPVAALAHELHWYGEMIDHYNPSTIKNGCTETMQPLNAR